jgi:toxin ParE1/3/4
MAEVRWTREAELWLKEIYEFIALDDENAGTRVIEEIREKARLLTDFPDMGFVFREEAEGTIRILL